MRREADSREVTIARTEVHRAVAPSRDRLAAWAHYGSLGVGALGLLWLGRNHWFISDDWEFITNRGLSHPSLGLFVPHTQHWSTAPILVYRALLNAFGLRSYLPYLAVNVAGYLIVIHLAWRVAVRAGSDPGVATGVAALLMVSAATGDTASYAFQISFEGSIALGLGLLLLVDHRDLLGAMRASTIAIVAVVSLTFSSVSLPLIGAAAVLSALRRGWRVTAAVLAPSACAFTLWYALVGRDTIGRGQGSVEIGWPALSQAPRFVVDGIASSLTGPLFIRAWVIVPLGIVATCMCFVLARRWRGPPAIALAAAFAAVAFFFLTSLGRGAATPSQTRYLFVGGALLMPVATLAVNALWRRGALLRVVLLLAIIPLLGFNVRDLRRTALSQDDTNKVVRQRVLAVATLLNQHVSLPGGLVPEADLAPDLDVAKLRRLIRAGWVPAPRSVDPAELNRARRFPNVTVSAHPTAGGGVSVTLDGGSPAPRPCTKVNPVTGPRRVLAHGQRDGSVQLRASRPTGATVQRPGRTRRGDGPPMTVRLPADEPVFLRFLAAETDVIIPSWPVPVSVCA